MQRFLSRLTPFILVGIILIALIFGLVLLAYLFLFGAIVGIILYIFAWIRATFFTQKPPIKSRPTKGRIIDSDDWDRL